MKGTLKTPEEFRKARKGKRVHSSFFFAIVTQSEEARFTVVTAKTVGKAAVTRNTIKRVAREAYRAAPVVGTLLLTAKPEAGAASKAELREDLDRLLARLA